MRPAPPGTLASNGPNRISAPSQLHRAQHSGPKSPLPDRIQITTHTNAPASGNLKRMAPRFIQPPVSNMSALRPRSHYEGKVRGKGRVFAPFRSVMAMKV